MINFNALAKLHVKHTFLYLILIGFVLSFSAGCDSTEAQATENNTLTVYCGAGLKTIMTEIATNYEEETGTHIEYIFNGSGMLLSQIETTETGDLFIPGESSFIDKLKQDNGDKAVIDQIDLFKNVPVILINKELNSRITSLESLTLDELELGMGEESIAIGKLFGKIMDKNNLRASIEKNIKVRFGTVNQVVSSVELEQVDAGVAFYINYVDCNQDKISMICIPNDQNVMQMVSLSILGYTENEQVARDFMEYVAEKGSLVYERYQYPE